jgi:hypothetical protein
MSNFLDTRGNSTLGVGLCARCSKKLPLGELSPDPNYPALMICADDRDDYDPYRLAPRATDNTALPFYRPDDPLNTGAAPIGCSALYSGGARRVTGSRS